MIVKDLMGAAWGGLMSYFVFDRLFPDSKYKAMVTAFGAAAGFAVI